ncbi:hypothetical protein GQ44DRAFT_327723 [Phaeosphaeriaceae sp. PMI808]|nr:hypothetical protein GQ44DRAFT_327723 [Phaeosphaeriaceae sp. PMI808]
MAAAGQARSRRTGWSELKGENKSRAFSSDGIAVRRQETKCSTLSGCLGKGATRVGREEQWTGLDYIVQCYAQRWRSVCELNCSVPGWVGGSVGHAKPIWVNVPSDESRQSIPYLDTFVTHLSSPSPSSIKVMHMKQLCPHPPLSVCLPFLLL